MTVDRRDGPTPAGGDYSEAFYCDDEGREVEPERATHVVIRELDRKGRLLAETWGTIERSPPTPPPRYRRSATMRIRLFSASAI